MSGDYFPNKFFPDNYFPGRYFQGGEQNPGAMSASLSGSGTISADLVGIQTETRKPKDNRRTRTPLFISAAEEDERRRQIAALEAAKTAALEAENAKKAKARREAVRKVFAQLREAGEIEAANRLEEDTQAALEAKQAQERARLYALHIERITTEINAILAEQERLLQAKLAYRHAYQQRALTLLLAA